MHRHGVVAPERPADGRRPGRAHRRTAGDAAQLGESRHGFPQPIRLAGGHRRYAERDVGAVREVLQSRSVYAELRRRHVELTPQWLSKASLVALSHAIEDECCARAEEPLLFGGDYGAATVTPDGTMWLASEYIASRCTDAQFAADTTCGYRRSFYANWSTHITAVAPLP